MTSTIMHAHPRSMEQGKNEDGPGPCFKQCYSNCIMNYIKKEDKVRPKSMPVGKSQAHFSP